MKIEIVEENLKIHEIPLEEIIIKGNEIKVFFDTEDEQRYCITFKTCQAIKVVTIDCVDVHKYLDNNKRIPNILEIIKSDWICELKSQLQKNDCTADFMDNAHHYVILSFEQLTEIIAFDNYSIMKVK
jgi:hypothetical protein